MIKQHWRAERGLADSDVQTPFPAGTKLSLSPSGRKKKNLKKPLHDELLWTSCGCQQPPRQAGSQQSSTKACHLLVYHVSPGTGTPRLLGSVRTLPPVLGGLRLASGKLVTHEPTGSHSRSSHGLGEGAKGCRTSD